jgi:hypothetical protein
MNSALLPDCGGVSSHFGTINSASDINVFFCFFFPVCEGRNVPLGCPQIEFAPGLEENKEGSKYQPRPRISWITIRMINDKARNDTDLNKCGASSLPRRSAATSSARNNFLCRNKCYETTSDEEV